MAVIDINFNPTRRSLVVFALMFAALMGVLGVMATAKPQAAWGAALVTGAAFFVSIVFNKEQLKKAQLCGAVIPLALLLIVGLERAGVSGWCIAVAAWATGVVGGTVVLASPELGKKFYLGWMNAAVPMGWTMSHVILGVIFYLVITPIGLVMRAAGRDAMQRRFDRKAASYWIDRGPAAPSSRYFRQF